MMPNTSRVAQRFGRFVTPAHKETARRSGLRWLWAILPYIGFGYVALYWILIFGLGGGGDARVYWAGGHAVLTGQNPWDADASGWHFGSFPPTALLFAPAGLLQESVFVLAWMVATLISAVYIVRRLELPLAWLLYPPLVMGVELGNPIVVSMALVLAGWGLLGAVMRPQHALVVLVRSPRTLIPLALIGVVSVLLLPVWIDELGTIATRYAIESGQPVNAWGSWWMVPTGIALALIARRDLQLAAWLLPAVLLPGAGFYAAMAFMVTKRPWLALVAAIPIAGMMPLATVLLAAAPLAVLLRDRWSKRDDERSRSHGEGQRAGLRPSRDGQES